MTGLLLEEMMAARLQRKPHVLVTVVATKGSVPRAAGAKMLVYPTGETSGTIGGGKFESLVIAEAMKLGRSSVPLLRTYPLHEQSSDSFGAICGGEVTVVMESQMLPPALYLVGAGHCAQALADLARTCEWQVITLDDRTELLGKFPSTEAVNSVSPADYIQRKSWQPDEALVLVSRNFMIDRDSLHAALNNPGMGYLGMIGSERKVRRVAGELMAEGFSAEQLNKVYTPVGLDIGADHPAEIAVSVFAEVMQVMRGKSGRHLKLDFSK